MKTTDISNFIEDAFKEFNQSIKDKDVGGETYIIRINPDNSITELKTTKFLNFDNYNDFLNKIRKGEIFPIYWRSWGEKHLKEVLKED